MSTSKAQTKKERLLEAAGRVFVEKAFRDATVAEICDLAGANIASVNYYFGGKEALYKETWRHSLTESLKAYPIDGGVPASAPAEERLRGQLVSLIRRFSDEKSIDFLIARMEMVNPSGLLEEVMASELGPVRRQTLALVRELLGPDATEQQVNHCEVSIASMCIHPVMMQRLARQDKGRQMPVIIDDMEAFADQVVRFALAGIRAERAEGSRK